MTATFLETVLPADSVEFCPHPSAEDVFVCGTYKLEDSDPCKVSPNQSDRQHRRGQCLVFRVRQASSIEESSSFDKIQEISLPAVLDMKWCHMSRCAPAILGVADSSGNVTLHEWSDTQLRLNVLDSVICAPDDVLCLSLDWSNRRHPSTNLGSLVVSLSNGSLCLLRPTNAMMSVAACWTAHDHEPWAAAWNYWDPYVIYSGGDDLKLKGWDTRQGFTKPVFINKRFDAGVTAIQSHPHVEHILAIGTYDDTVRLFDVRKPQTAISQVDVGGGAWRVKWHPLEERRNDLLVACMHDGFKIVQFDFGGQRDSELVVNSEGRHVKHFDKHRSLAYGVDWSFAASDSRETLIGSCSFYDHALYMWSG